MDCIEAQAAISDAIDRVPVDAEVLEAAKEHCRSCTECGTFVRALTIVKRAPLPAPPEDLTERVMTVVRAEAALLAAEREAEAAETAALAAAQAEADAGTVAPEEGIESESFANNVVPLADTPPRRPRMSRRATVSVWSAAAAVFIAGVVMITIGSIRSMSNAPQASQTGVSAEKSAIPLGSANAPAATDQTNRSAASGAGAAHSAQSTPYGAASSPSFITMSGAVYKLAGPDNTVAAGQLSTVGQTSTALDGQTQVQHTVLRGTDPARVYIQTAPSTLVAFERVTRTYAGKTYGLTSESITKYGVWPTLPGTIVEPTAADGSPTFTALGHDESGVTVYKLASDSADIGIAVAPRTSASDPAGGNPNWTWWTPIH